MTHFVHLQKTVTTGTNTKTMKQLVLALFLTAAAAAVQTSAFLPHGAGRAIIAGSVEPPVSMFLSSSADEWVNLLEDNHGNDPKISTCPVKKLVLKEGQGDVPTLGSKVDIEYVGTFGSSQINWTVEDVVECWLKNQQGLYNILAQPFRENEIDGKILMNEDLFNEAYVSETLGVENKILCKKTVMAAKRLRTQLEEYPQGKEFDSSVSRGKTFQFTLGQGKVIKAIDLLVSTMRVGEEAKVMCRADYGYGSEGYRKANGEVLVPPFATLCFEIKLLSMT